MKDPNTGKRVSRHNPESEWVVQEVPELRIVDQEVWDAVKARQKTFAFTVTKGEEPDGTLNDRRRPKHLFAGLVKCGCCGGGYSMISKNLLGCSTSRNKGTCRNLRNIRRDALEASVLNGLRTHLMDPALFKEFCDAFTREMNRLRIEQSANVIGHRKELERVQRELDRAIQAILDGVPGIQLKDKIGRLETRKAELIAMLSTASEPPPLLHPNMAEVYRQRIARLHERLQSEETKAEAVDILRGLVDRITLQPDGNGLAIVLRGDLAAMLSFAANTKLRREYEEARPPCGDRACLRSRIASIVGCGGRI
ncbi:recombinase zinc beta ribbon domain-containing protein [Azospirillum lipoferum]|uniref:recombinase zinc beta ribbon domain-containing protein n=1 Tax=Azospirillum lipoferum TaxID=193 RepID=UPI0031B7FB4D